MNASAKGILIGMILMVVVTPFIPLLLWSVSGSWFYPDLVPEKIGFRAWNYIFDTAGSMIAVALFKSIWVSSLTAFTSVTIGVFAGRVLGLYQFPGKNLVALILALPIIVPPLSVAMGINLWFLKLGITETVIGVVLVHLTVSLPYAVFVMWGVFANYNPDYEDQARSLGASSFQVFTRIRLPFVLPGVITAALFSFLLSWSQYLNTLIIGGGKVNTLPIMLFALMDSGDRPVAGAVSLIFVVPAFLTLIFSAGYLTGSEDTVSK